MNRSTAHATSDNTSDLATKPKRRTFTAAYKLRIVAEYDTCTTGTKPQQLHCWPRTARTNASA
ncbi:hypothetical protein [Nocardiopsis rhodophaea]|uniref:hypothetical protein n=1 Tax=Nocardiopsis rhodophaea TaxID=280238 RepID=UPI0031CE5ABB